LRLRMGGVKPLRHAYDCLLCIATNLMFYTKLIRPSADRQTDRQTDSQTDRQSDRQSDRQTDGSSYKQSDRQTAVPINRLRSFKLLHTNYAAQVLCWSPRVRVVSRTRVYNAVSCSFGVCNAHSDLHISTAVYI
jgi:hypothetical protein